ncbi:ABC transporter ATP-binding protein [Streptococcus oriscaviae]|uniref:ATP-binding cassette domain-containing protein n=1 Tax=Streptococcus oriscaviae TaxID=2781599 RepID=A0ABX7YJB8_9STRE|nr:ATP-binding cassette domain-containing protein [Streptococcus oriscaviae]QUE53374.1 ATP-binding cassette domain-containing protein [Streptococcus oriscaviae]
MINLENIQKKYRDTIIFESANFHADAGQIVLILGKSGIGKTTLLEIIAGLRTLDSGEYVYQGSKLSFADDETMSAFRNKHVGYILQDFALIEDYTVVENLLLPVLYSQTVSREEAAAHAESLAGKFGLSNVLDKKIKSVSGGQKQRVAIIRSLILKPDILLADEPTTNLDKENFQLIIDMFQELKKEGKCIIIATHDERILEFADKVYQIEHKKITLLEKIKALE